MFAHGFFPGLYRLSGHPQTPSARSVAAAAAAFLMG
jgi:hypothetical protein